MYALVTGASGFLGRHVVKQLVLRGDRVRTFCRREHPELAPLGVEIVQGDIRDRAAVIEACRGVDVVFHVAAITGIWGRWQDFYETNTRGTEYVVEGCRQHGVSRLVYTSSPSVTYSGRDQLGIDESTPYPTSWYCHYPHSKALAEQYVLNANDTSDLKTCSLRPHLIWGPRDENLFGRLIKQARSGKLCQVGPGGNMIDTVYVENAASAHLLAAEALQNAAPAAGRAYFISQGEPVNCWEWINRLLAVAGLPPVEKTISHRAAKWFGRLCEATYRTFHLPGEPPMTRFLADQLSTSHYFDISRARNELGYEPTISTEEGLDRLATSYSR